MKDFDLCVHGWGAECLPNRVRMVTSTATMATIDWRLEANASQNGPLRLIIHFQNAEICLEKIPSHTQLHWMVKIQSRRTFLPGCLLSPTQFPTWRCDECQANSSEFRLTGCRSAINCAPLTRKPAHLRSRGNGYEGSWKSQDREYVDKIHFRPRLSHRNATSRLMTNHSSAFLGATTRQSSC